MHEKAHTREVMMPNGEVLESVFCEAIHYVLYVNALVLWSPRRLWIISFLIEETYNCSGTKRTGSPSAGTAMIGKLALEDEC